MNPVSLASIRYQGLWYELSQPLLRVTVQILGQRGNHGAGVVWSSEGLIVTNAHVSSGSSVIRLHDGRNYNADLVRRDPAADLAMLHIPAPGIESARLGDSTKPLRTGEMVLAVGHPMGAPGAISAGIVSKIASDSFIETDVRLAPGNSGGPLADAEGHVVGINCMVVHGIGIAISTAAIRSFVQGAKAVLEGSG